MPSPGHYETKRISLEEYRQMATTAIATGKYQSSIGYPDNVRMIAQITGHTVPLSRKETILKDKDTMLIMKLRYRTDGYKQRRVALEDFEFFLSTYRS